MMLSYIFSNTPLKFFIQSFWRDEAFSYAVAKENIVPLLVGTAKDFSPPLYYIVLKLWMFFFGFSEIALRSLSLLFYWGTLYIIYLVLTDIIKFTTKKSLYYLLLFLFNPLLTYYAFEARGYSMLAFLATLSFYAYFQRKIRLYQIVTALGLYTHYFMVPVSITQLLFSYFTERKKPHFCYLVRSVSIPLLLFLPWALFLLTQKTLVSESFWIPPFSLKDIFLLPSLIYTGYEKDLGFLTVSSLLWISLLLLLLLFFGYKKVRLIHSHHLYRIFTFFLFWAAVPTVATFFLSLYKPLFLPRYLIFATVGFLFLMVLALEYIERETRILFIALLFLVTYAYHRIQLTYRVKNDMAKTIKEIKSLAEKDDVIYVINELDYFTAQYYFDSNRVFIYGKTYEELPSYVGKALIPKQRVVMYLPAYPKKAFILRNETNYDIQSLY